ncbi:MAG TPA: PEP-CTERM sorting domain-containing protein [Rubrivivax sp.]
MSGFQLNKLAGAAAVALMALSAAPAMADAPEVWSCGDLSFEAGAVSYVDCKGAFAPPPNDTVAAVNDLIFTPDVTVVYQYKDNNTGVGSDVSQIDFEQGANGAGSLTFGVALTDPFVISVKLGQRWSAYLFDLDVSAGTTWDFAYAGESTQGLGLSHGSLFTGELVTNPVPEPETYALMLAGLAAVSFVARRRKSAK